VEILVLHPGALGDIILSLPALRMLRSNFPDAIVTLAGNTDFTRAVATGYADRLVSLSSLPLHRLYSSSEVPLEDERLWCSFDRVLSWTGHGTEAITGRLSRLHPCVLSAPWKPQDGDRRHVSRIFLDTLTPWLRPPMEAPFPEIGITPDDRQRGASWLKKKGWNGTRLLAVHPGAGSREKRWPKENFAELLQRLSSSATPVIVEGPAEPGLAKSLAAGLAVQIIAAFQLPLVLLAAVLSHCSAYVGQTSPMHWAPLGRNVVIQVCSNGRPAPEDEPDTYRSSLPEAEIAAVYREVKRMINNG
jgi:ADP-heptose:LPS heptosyltransferase